MASFPDRKIEKSLPVFFVIWRRIRFVYFSAKRWGSQAHPNLHGLKNFTAILRAIDTNALCDETSGAFKCTGTVSRMLFVFSDYMRYLEAMVLVGDFADERLRYGCLPEQ